MIQGVSPFSCWKSWIFHMWSLWILPNSSSRCVKNSWRQINGGGGLITTIDVVVVWDNWEMRDFNVGVENVNPTPNLVTLDDDVVGVAIEIVVWTLALNDDVVGVVGIVVWALAMVAPSLKIIVYSIHCC